jgi:hypothetical protein
MRPALKKLKGLLSALLVTDENDLREEDKAYGHKLMHLVGLKARPASGSAEKWIAETMRRWTIDAVGRKHLKLGHAPAPEPQQRN